MTQHFPKIITSYIFILFIAAFFKFSSTGSVVNTSSINDIAKINTFVSKELQSPLPTYQDFFPSFQQLDCVIENLKCTFLCPLNCASCLNQLTCSNCTYGYFLLNNSCFPCPKDCKNCSLLLNFSQNFMCDSSGTSYYYEFKSVSYLPCSFACTKCLSNSECMKCKPNYFLKYNDNKNFSCELCSLHSNCSTCLFGNISQSIGYEMYNQINTIQIFNSFSIDFQWSLTCLNCVSEIGYTRKRDGLCYSCSELIQDCLSCSFGNDSVPNISVFYNDSLIFMNLSQYNDSCTVRCYDCRISTFPLIIGHTTSCVECTSHILNCSSCNYGFWNPSNSLIYPNDFYNVLYQSNENYKLRCLRCQNSFILNDSNQTVCANCPDNCESCFLNSSSNSYFCGRCKDNYVLSIYDGLCFDISNYPNAANYYNGSCLKIVSNNPWSSILYGRSSNYLCQKCQKTSNYPSISGLCLTCANSTCISCYEASTYISDPNFVNYTDLLYNNPLSLIDQITTTLRDYRDIQRCLTCSDPNFGYNNIYQYCCIPNQSIIIDSSQMSSTTIIDGCSTCSSCSTLQNNIACDHCVTCLEVDNNDLNNYTIVKSISYTNELYGKRIYYILKNEAVNFVTIPILNDTYTYASIINNLNYQTKIDLIASKIYSCTACPINSFNCYIPDLFDYDSISSAFTYKQIDFTQQLSYQLKSFDCQNGFIYDYKLQRCKFCPQNWTNCKAYKRINFTFSETASQTDPFTITSLQNLLTTFEILEGESFSFIANEFAIEFLEIFLFFPSNSSYELSYSSIDFSLKSDFKNRIPSLQNFSLIFQPQNYESNNDDISYIYWPIKWYLSGFDNVYFRNIIFYIYPYYYNNNLNLVYPGLNINSTIDSFEMKNCGIQKIGSTGKNIYDGFLSVTTQPSLNPENPFDLFSMNIFSSAIIFANISLNCSIFYPDAMFFGSATIFNLEGETLEINNMYITQLNLRHVSLIQFYFNSIDLNTLSFTNTHLEIGNVLLDNSNGDSNVSISNIYITDSQFLQSYFIGGYFAILEISNISILNSNFTMDIYFFNTDVINLNTILIQNNSFDNYKIFQIYKNPKPCSILNLVFINNTCFLNDVIFNAIISSVDVTLLLFQFINLTFISNYVVSNSQEVQPFFFILSNIQEIQILNVLSINNLNISFFKMEEINDLNISNFQMINDELNYIDFQDGLLLNSIHMQILIKSCFFENITTFDGLINIQDWVIDYMHGSIDIQNVVANNIYFFENDLYIGSSILVYGRKLWNIEIYNCSFSNSYLNDLSDYDGSSLSISLDSILSNFSLQSCSFLNLTSIGKYGVLFLNLDQILLENCNFYSINYYMNDLAPITLGNIINLKCSNIVINNTNFNQSVGFQGGAIYINPINKICNINIFNSNFSYIYSLADGGVFYYQKLTDKNSNINIFKCIFEFIFSSKSGGILYSIALTNNFIIFMKCQIFSFDSVLGSVLFTEFSNVSFFNSSIGQNYINCYLDIVNQFVSDSCALFFIQATLFLQTDSSLDFYFVVIAEISSTQKYPSILNLNNVVLTSVNSFFNSLDFYYNGFLIVNSDIFLNNNTFTLIQNQDMIDGQTDVIFSFINLQYSTINILNSFISQISCGICLYGSFIYSKISTVSLNNSIFEKNYAINAGVIYLESSMTDIENCAFNYNLALNFGGTLYILTSFVMIFNSHFTYNIAKVTGGAIYFLSSSDNENINISNSVFLNNNAEVAGAIYYQINTILIYSCMFSNNTAAFYGNSFYSYPRSFLILDEHNKNYTNNSLIIKNFRSGDILPQLLVVMLDEENNPVNLILNSDIAQILPLNLELIYSKPLNSTGNYFFSINKSSIQITNNGNFIINYLKLIAKPSDLVSISLSSGNIYVPEITINTLTVPLVQNYNFNFSIELRPCIIGEIFENSTGICSPCLNGYFSFNLEDEICSKCLDGLNCSTQTPTIQKGFWRRTNYSLIILSCYNNYESCIGGNSSGDSICLKGHIGARCESCDLTGNVWGDIYSRSTGNSCVECSELSYNYIILAILTVVNFVSMAFSIIGALNQIELLLKLKVIGLLSRYSMLKTSKNECSIYIKIYLAYFQILQVISTMDLSYPSWITIFATSIGNPTQTAMYSFDCAIRFFQNIIPYIYIKLLIALSIPFLYFLIFSIGYILVIYLFKIHRKYSLLYTASLFTLIYFQPTIVENTIGVLSCISIGDEIYIKADVSFLCETSEYWFYSFIIALPSLLLWGLIVPGLILWRLIINRNKLNDIWVKVRYGYIYNEYKIFYWEFIKMYEKIFITCFLQFYETEIIIKGLLILLIVAIYLILVSKYKPYHSITLTKVDQISTSVLSISIFLGLLSYKNSFGYIVNISYLAIIIINLVYNIFMIFQILKTFSSKFEVILNKLKKIFPKFFFDKKPTKTLNKWKIVRRSVAKYLRERERRKLENNKFGLENKLNLTICDYDPEDTGVRRQTNKNKILIIEEEDNSRIKINSSRELNSFFNANKNRKEELIEMMDLKNSPGDQSYFIKKN